MKVVIISRRNLFFVGLIIILLLSLSVAAASDDTTLSKDVKDKKIVKSPTTNMNKQVSKNKVTNVTKKVTKEKTKSNVTKKVNKNVKTATQKDINNYEELYNTLTTSTDDDLTVSLNGDDKYTINTDQIEVNENIKKLVINGNGRTIDGADEKLFLKSENTPSLVINDLTIANCTSYLGTLNYKSGNLTLNNVNFTDILIIVIIF